MRSSLRPADDPGGRSLEALHAPGRRASPTLASGRVTPGGGVRARGLPVARCRYSCRSSPWAARRRAGTLARAEDLRLARRASGQQARFRMRHAMTSTTRKSLACLALFLTLGCGQPGPIEPVRPQDEASLGPLLQKTVAEYLARVEEQPASAATHGRLGLLYEANLLTSEAARSYANALTLDPDDPAWNFRLGIVKVALGDLEEGAARLLAAVDAMPESAAAQQRVGYLHLDQGDLELAVVSFRQAVNLAAENVAPLAEASLGEALVAIDRPAEAIEPLEHALQAAPTLKPALYAYGLAQRALGRIDQAEIALEAGLGAQRIMITHPSGVDLQRLGMGYDLLRPVERLPAPARAARRRAAPWPHRRRVRQGPRAAHGHRELHHRPASRARGRRGRPHVRGGDPPRPGPGGHRHRGGLQVAGDDRRGPELARLRRPDVRDLPLRGPGALPAPRGARDGPRGALRDHRPGRV